VKKQDLIRIVQAFSASDLKGLISTKSLLEPLEGEKNILEKQLASIDKEIASLQNRIGMPKVRKQAAKLKGRPRRAAKKERIVQPSLSSFVVQILKEKKKPQKVNDITEALLSEKKYKTQAKNFKANVRILLYKNDKKLFKKVGPGQYGLATKTKRAEEDQK